MTEITGEFGTAVVYADEVEESAAEQIRFMMDQPMSAGANVKIMPDVHAGAGCVIGYTAKITDQIVPNLVGVDIGCGVLANQVEPSDRRFSELHQSILESVPSGFAVRGKVIEYLPEAYERITDGRPWEWFERSTKEVCERMEQDQNRVWLSIGTLGGGNHFIEVNEDQDGKWWLVIHSGSRNFGLKIANYHQKIAQRMHPEVIKSIAFLTGDEASQYLHDMEVAQVYAKLNRFVMAWELLDHFFRLEDPSYSLNEVESVHNFIDMEDGIIRKGAIRAYAGEPVVIPFNMAFGSVIGVGKSNEEWNYSASHGAGRVMGRKQAKATLTLEDFKDSMRDVYSETVTEGTLDEAPMAYKNPDVVLENIRESVEVTHRLVPLFNFKAGA